MIGNKIRSYREFRGLNQIQLAELSGINVGTIRKYELGIRNPKPDQLEKIATALGLNVSVFLDFNIATVGDVLSLLFAIDDAVNLDLVDNTENQISNVGIAFKDGIMQKFFQEWCQFKTAYKNDKDKILTIEDKKIRDAELENLDRMYEEWKLRAMGTTVGCHQVIKKNGLETQ